MAAASRRKSRENSGVALRKARKTKPMRKNAAGSGADLGALTRRELVSLVNQLRSKCAEVHASGTSAAASSQVDSAEPAPTSLVIDGSVRSGQVIEFLEARVPHARTFADRVFEIVDLLAEASPTGVTRDELVGWALDGL